MDEDKDYLSCSFAYVSNDGQIRSCGNRATHQFHHKPLCSTCAQYVKGIRGNVTEMSKETIEKKLTAQKKRAERRASV